MSYLALDAAEIVRTIERLRNRIEERFPGSGLGSVCGQLLEISRRARAGRVDCETHSGVRVATAVLAVVIVAGLALMVTRLRPRRADSRSLIPGLQHLNETAPARIRPTGGAGASP